MAHTGGSEVVLNLYDLSMGMARGMSMAFIGKQIDYIPHTGIVVYGNEYFYGGGIQVLPPHQVVEYFGLAPIEKIPLGRTTKSLEELRGFLRSISHRFSPTTYDLFRNNCNNFTNEVSQFLLGTTIPDRILRVPAEVLSTPMGAMIGSMWSNMQNNMASRMGDGGAAWDPFTGGRGVSAPALPTGIPADAAPATPQVPATNTAACPTLGKANRPLLSAEPGNVKAVVDKLIAVNDSLPADSPHRLTEKDKQLLNGIPSVIATVTPEASTSGVPSRTLLTSSLAICDCLTRCLRTWPRSSCAFPVLALLRLLVLREECVVHMASSAVCAGDVAAEGAGSVTLDRAMPIPEVGVLWDVLETLAADASGYGTAAANIMALSVLANAFKTTIGVKWAVDAPVLHKLIDISMRDIRTERKEVRQLAAALAFNVANAMPVGSDTAASVSSSKEGEATVLVTDASVQLLGGLLEDIASEKDVETARRRLLAAGRLIKREGVAAAELMCTLGFADILSNYRATADPSIKDLVAEVSGLLDTTKAF